MPCLIFSFSSAFLGCTIYVCVWVQDCMLCVCGGEYIMYYVCVCLSAGVYAVCMCVCQGVYSSVWACVKARNWLSMFCHSPGSVSRLDLLLSLELAVFTTLTCQQVLGLWPHPSPPLQHPDICFLHGSWGSELRSAACPLNRELFPSSFDCCFSTASKMRLKCLPMSSHGACASVPAPHIRLTLPMLGTLCEVSQHLT